MKKNEILVKSKSGGEYTVSLAYYFANKGSLEVVDANGLEKEIKAGVPAPKNKMADAPKENKTKEK